MNVLSFLPCPGLPWLQKLKATGLKAAMAAIQSLDTWAGPIKSAAAAVALTPDAGASGAGGASVGGGSGQGGEVEAPRDREARGGAWEDWWGWLRGSRRAGGCLGSLPLAEQRTDCTSSWLCRSRPFPLQELQRILADKELKDALLAGTERFNQNAVKGGWPGPPLPLCRLWWWRCTGFAFCIPAVARALTGLLKSLPTVQACASWCSRA